MLSGQRVDKRARVVVVAVRVNLALEIQPNVVRKRLREVVVPAEAVLMVVAVERVQAGARVVAALVVVPVLEVRAGDCRERVARQAGYGRGCGGARHGSRRRARARVKLVLQHARARARRAAPGPVAVVVVVARYPTSTAITDVVHLNLRGHAAQAYNAHKQTSQAPESYLTSTTARRCLRFGTGRRWGTRRWQCPT